MIDNKLTVTIGIPAYNEEKSISNLLDSIIEQTQKDYVLEKVIVACDGCTDKTSEVVSEYVKKYNFIEK
jgi:glycosyltransferase involved in cell wall biosynthesis